MSQGTSERNELRSSRFFAPLHTTASWKDTAATQNAENSTRNMASGFEAKETTPKGISSAEPTYVMDDEVCRGQIWRSYELLQFFFLIFLFHFIAAISTGLR